MNVYLKCFFSQYVATLINDCYMLYLQFDLADW